MYEWCKEYIRDFLNGNTKLTFVSSATLYNPAEYFETAKLALEELGLHLEHLDLNDNPESKIEKAKALLVGGGNTYHLLKMLNDHGLTDKISTLVKTGVPYIGLSAGANIVGPTILTTNDWNIDGIANFKGLNLIPFNINPHYISPHDKTIFSGENRDERILEFHAVNDNAVLGIEEKTFLMVEDKKITVGGLGNAKLFIKGKEPALYKPGQTLQIQA